MGSKGESLMALNKNPDAYSVYFSVQKVNYMF